MTPGAPDAIAAGCVCDPLENMFGRGCSPRDGEPREFVVRETCPLHGHALWRVLKGTPMRLVVLESPFAGRIDANIAFAKEAVRDCLHRGESPIASHLLFTQPGILRDDVPGERRLGIDAGWAWYRVASAAIFYLNHGMSGGMAGALAVAEALSVPVEFRFIEPIAMLAEINRHLHPVWSRSAFHTEAEGTVAEGQAGRLEVSLNRRAPTPQAAFEARLAGRTVAFYGNMEAAQAGAVLYDMASKRWGDAHREAAERARNTDHATARRS